MGKAKPKNGKQRHAKIYRQFTRIKFTKYKLQYPRIRESQIIAKIIKQWQAMDENAKQDLAQQFIQKSGSGFLQDPSSSDKQKKTEKKQKSLPMSSSAIQSKKTKPTEQQLKKPPSPKVRVFTQKQQLKQPNPQQGQDYRNKSSSNSKTPGKKSTPQKKSSSSSQLAIKNAKRISKVSTPLQKILQKQKQQKLKQQYVSYYKYYYDRLRAQHPRWNNAQLTTIIKLLWKKKFAKRSKRQAKRRILTGRQLYNQTKQSQGYLRQQIKQLWKALPHESKRYWQIKALGRPHRSKKDSGRFVRKILNLGSNKPQILPIIPTEPKIPFNWLNQPII